MCVAKTLLEDISGSMFNGLFQLGFTLCTVSERICVDNCHRRGWTFTSHWSKILNLYMLPSGGTNKETDCCGKSIKSK
jgi:hypothetical protein